MWLILPAAKAGSAQDETGDFLWMGNDREMAGLQLNRIRLHTVRKKPLQLRHNSSVLRRNGIPRRLGPPRCHFGL